MSAEQNAPRRRGLGRGLGALIVNTESLHTESLDVEGQGSAISDAAAAGGVRHIPLDRIQPNPHQPRTDFEPVALQELADSIRQHGILQPLIVSRRPDEVEAYWLVTGERRWRAAQLAGLSEAPALVRDATPRQLMEWALVENLQRADLNPLEEAAAYQTLVLEFGLTQAEVAERVGKSRPAVANALRLLHLPPAVQTDVAQARLSAGHARALLALADGAAITEAAAQVIARQLSVRQTEELVKQLLAVGTRDVVEAPAADDSVAALLRQMENSFRSSLGTRVQLNRNPDGSGRLVVHFYNDDDLQHLYKRMIGDADS